MAGLVLESGSARIGQNSASLSLLPNIPALHLNLPEMRELTASSKATNSFADNCHWEEVFSLGPHCSSSLPSLGQHKAELHC